MWTFPEEQVTFEEAFGGYGEHLGCLKGLACWKPQLERGFEVVLWAFLQSTFLEGTFEAIPLLIGDIPIIEGSRVSHNCTSGFNHHFLYSSRSQLLSGDFVLFCPTLGQTLGK